MLVERSELTVRDGSAPAFEAAMREKALPMMKEVPGVLSLRFGPSIENPDRFIILVEWESLDAHSAFSDHPVYPEFRACFSPHTATGLMEHFEVDEI